MGRNVRQGDDAATPSCGGGIPRIQRTGCRFHFEWIQRYPLLLMAALLIAGGSLGLQWDDPPAAAIRGVAISCGLCWLAAAILWLSGTLAMKPAAKAGFWAVVGSGLVAAGTYSGLTSQPPVDDWLSRAASREQQPVAVRAVIESAAVWRPNPYHRVLDPNSQPWLTQWNVRCESVRDDDQWVGVDCRSTLSVPGRVDRWLPGDVLEVYGSFRAIRPATNPGAVDMKAYARRYGRMITLVASDLSQLTALESRWQYPWQRLRGWTIREVDRQLRRWVTHGQSPLAAALVFGQREQVDWEDQQELMATGTLHMLAISGLHVEIVAAGMLLVCWLFRASNGIRLCCVIAICGLYAGLADGKPPVLRAAILVMAVELARHLGRPARLGNLLSLAAIVLILLQASNLQHVGVHLSFLAVASIGVFVLDRRGVHPTSRVSPLERLERKLDGRASRLWHLGTRWLWGMLRLSFWVWLITSPLVWYHFHVLAPVAIPLNVAISVPLGIGLLTGLVAGLFGWLPPLGFVAGQVCGICLGSINWLVGVGARLPFGHLWLPSPKLWWILLFYGISLLWLLVLRRRWRSRLGALLTIWLMLGVGMQAFGPRGFTGWQWGSKNGGEYSELRVTFLDVGHGTSVLMELPDGRIWLYDAGHLGTADRSHQEIAAALWEVGASRIDKLILSHADADHYNAVPGLVERFRIAGVASTEAFWNCQDPGVVEAHQRLRAHRTAFETWSAGDRGETASVAWEVLHPAAHQVSESDNASSLCLLLQFGDQRVLLPGDLEGSGITSLIDLPPRPCHVLMAPHHGSLTRDPSSLLRWCQPELVVVSGNHRANRPAVLDLYAPLTKQLAITFRDGAVQYRVDHSGTASVYRWQTGWTRFMEAGNIAADKLADVAIDVAPSPPGGS